MGIIEVLGDLKRLLRIRHQLIKNILKENPNVFIGIDFPDFNISIEKDLKLAGIRTVHYVSPSIWAWRRNRIFKIQRSTDLILTLFPFEKQIYDKHDIPCSFVGHSLADEIALNPDKTSARLELKIREKSECLTLLPGSRQSEIARLSGVFLKALVILKRVRPRLKILAPMVNEERRRQFEKIKEKVAPDLPIEILDGRFSRKALIASNVALLASGTASLESMLAKCPMVVGYKVNTLTFLLASLLVKTNYISLPNLLSENEIVKEFLQNRCSPLNLAQAVETLLTSEVSRSQMLKTFFELHEKIRKDASREAQRAISRLF
jgi:lipid-A-disaccharide synthase